MGCGSFFFFFSSRKQGTGSSLPTDYLLFFSRTTVSRSKASACFRIAVALVLEVGMEAQPKAKFRVLRCNLLGGVGAFSSGACFLCV